MFTAFPFAHKNHITYFLTVYIFFALFLSYIGNVKPKITLVKHSNNREKHSNNQGVLFEVMRSCVRSCTAF